MLTGLFVVLFVEAPNQLLEDGAHGVVVECRQQLIAVPIQHRLGTEVDAGIQELFDEVPENIRLDERGDLVAEFEFVEDLSDVE